MREDTFYQQAHVATGGDTMTIQGAINKSFILLFTLLLGGYVSWTMPSPILLGVGVLGGFICVMIATFRPTTSPYTAPLYAAFEGLALGTISVLYQNAYHGIVFQAIALTLGILFFMLIIFKFKIVPVTDKLRAGIIMATGSVAVIYLVSMVLSFFGIHLPMIYDGGLFGIGFSAVVVVIAAMNLLLDFDTFEQGERAEAPAYMEWYAALGLMVTLVWLYMEILRLLSKLNRK